MDRGHAKLSDQIRQAIDASGMSRYRICKMTAIPQSTMSRFMAGKLGLSMSLLDRLGEALDLRIVRGGGRHGAPESTR